ncbi:MAG: helix-turn-helix transcriptional regulator, partial [Peptococcaceae bacterium]|nr:helix-turn-helix transcriptional regulator [Peptococcaceae bacterium]
MDIAIKIKALLNMHGMTSAQLRQVASISRATWSRIMAGHVPSERTLARIANALDVSPGYLHGGYQLPAWLSEEDIMFLAGRKNAPL